MLSAHRNPTVHPDTSQEDLRRVETLLAQEQKPAAAGGARGPAGGHHAPSRQRQEVALSLAILRVLGMVALLGNARNSKELLSFWDAYNSLRITLEYP